jgi:hypothetical protein
MLYSTNITWVYEAQKADIGLLRLALVSHNFSNLVATSLAQTHMTT